MAVAKPVLKGKTKTAVITTEEEESMLVFCVVTPLDLYVDTSVSEERTVSMFRAEVKLLESVYNGRRKAMVRGIGQPQSRNEEEMVQQGTPT
jgi:hypothetical protein